jgi:hypothetical protein
MSVEESELKITLARELEIALSQEIEKNRKLSFELEKLKSSKTSQQSDVRNESSQKNVHSAMFKLYLISSDEYQDFYYDENTIGGLQRCLDRLLEIKETIDIKKFTHDEIASYEIVRITPQSSGEIGIFSLAEAIEVDLDSSHDLPVHKWRSNWEFPKANDLLKKVETLYYRCDRYGNNLDDSDDEVNGSVEEQGDWLNFKCKIKN